MAHLLEAPGPVQAARPPPVATTPGGPCLGARSCMHSIMRYERDVAKAKGNLSEHRVHFADAVAVVQDERALTVEDPYPDEERYVTIGMDAFARVLVVVYT
jgi:uncharacterized protein